MTLDTGSRSCAETKLISKRWNCDIIIVVSVVTVVMKITSEICFNNGGGYGDLLVVMVMVTVTDLVTIIWDKRIKLRGSEGAKVLCFFMGFFIYLFLFLFFFFLCGGIKKILDGMFEGASFSEVQKFRIHELSKGWFGH